jgi:hypothetical protein
MGFSRLVRIGVFVALGVVSSARGAGILAPTGDEPQAQLKRDTDDCRRRATLHTGFDPNDPPSAEAPRKTSARMKPMPGKDSRVLQEEERLEDERARKKQQAEAEADLERRRADYDRAVKTCLAGLNHPVDPGAAPAATSGPGVSDQP